MKNKQKKIKLLLLAMGFFLSIVASPVKNACTLSKDFSVTIHGTSNLHAWDENVEIVTGEAKIVSNANGSFDLNAITISMDVHSIKSKEGSVMNNKTYVALKGETYPQILFTLSEPLKSISNSPTGGSNSVKGFLTIAGIKKPVTMLLKILLENGKLACEGKQVVKMSDFGIQPPTALFGMLKTGNEITINFKTNFAICD